MKTKRHSEITDFLKGYKHVSEMADEAVFIHSTKGAIFEVNSVAEKLTGYSRKELLKMNVRELHPKSEVKVSQKALGLISNSKVEVDFESKFQKKDGTLIDVRIIGDKFKFKRNSFVIGLVRDITRDRRFTKRKTAITSMDSKRLMNHLSPVGKEYSEPMHVLIEVAESRDPYTVEHSLKVTNFSVALAEALGLSKKDLEIIKLAAMFHDIGKIGIPAQVLMKTTCLSDREYDDVKKHPFLSVEIVKAIRPVKGILPIIMHHHENYDGSGYPSGLKANRIPIGARIIAITDVYDALTSERAYRKAYSYRESVRIMSSLSGKKFDPKILAVFLEYLFQKKQENNPSDKRSRSKR